jgi:hypothetical protein
MANLRTLGIAVGAGLASALLFAATAQGAGVALIMAYVTPLPIMIAALGFGHATGLVAAAVSSCGLALTLGLLPGLFFGLLLGFPSWLLPYLVLLARPLPAPNGNPGQPGLMLWYPVGRIMAWGAGLVAAVILGMGALLIAKFGGFDAAVSALAARLDSIIGQASADELAGAATARQIVLVLPVLMAASAFLMLVVNLWLAGRIVQRSGLLTRPWPSLPENIRLPRIAAAVFAASGLALLPSGAPRVAGGVVAAAFAMAFALQGLAAAHALTRGLVGRGLILLAIYLITISVVPSVVGLTILGVVDCLAPLRQRSQPTRPPLAKP